MVSNPEDICVHVRSSLIQSGLFSDSDSHDRIWRLAPRPYTLSQEELVFFSRLGEHLLKFYQGLNRLYLKSLKGKVPSWFAEYLDIGKPSGLIDFGRMNRFKLKLPGIIRPDIIVTENGFSVTELDSVPGGFGNLARLMTVYAEEGYRLPGIERGGIPQLFWRMIQSVASQTNPVFAMVVSEEAKEYFPEMEYLVKLLREKGYSAYAICPEDIVFNEDGLFLEITGGREKIDVLYRFFELFDLKNIPKSELVMYAAKKGKVRVTPPYKAFLEEKLALALFYHPVLRPYWENELGSETFEFLSHLIPRTWILDNRALSPQGVIPGLTIEGAAIQNWRELLPLSQKERELVVKISGFSSLSWGSRGVAVGHDVSSEEWRKVLEERIAKFDYEPSVLQTFHKGKRLQMQYMDFESGEMKTMDGRARLTPYYFFTGETVELGGILATLCHKDKKKIHGMTDAIMVPCAVA